MRIAVLALQGAFAEHRHVLSRLGVESYEVRQLSDWEQHKDGLILPGGESTVQSKLMRDLDLFEPIRTAICEGLPVFGTCAGLILLSSLHLGTMGIEAERNAYGRQLGSFRTSAHFGDYANSIPMTFIRAPYIKSVTSAECHVLAEVEGRIVAAQQGNQLATAFHPELDDDTSVHKLFISMVRQQSS